MLNKIKYQLDVTNFIRDAENMIEKYGWQEKTVMPYSFPVKVTKIINDLKDFDRCTESSQQYLISLANGLVPILNSWEKHEQAEKVEVRIKSSGKIIKIAREDFEMFSELIEYVNTNNEEGDIT